MTSASGAGRRVELVGDRHGRLLGIVSTLAVRPRSSGVTTPVSRRRRAGALVHHGVAAELVAQRGDQAVGEGVLRHARRSAGRATP